MSDGLTRGPLGRCLHVCVDMQEMFRRETEWHTPWLERVLPQAVRLVEAHPAETIFTRFVPAARPGEGQGTWKGYYERWASMTRERLGDEMIELVPELARFAPPATVVDKSVYSPWFNSALPRLLTERQPEAVVVSGGETDVCVLGTVLGAVDAGYRVVVVHDCLCSSSDEAHEASLSIYRSRYGHQVEVASAEEVLGAWEG